MVLKATSRSIGASLSAGDGFSKGHSDALAAHIPACLGLFVVCIFLSSLPCLQPAELQDPGVKSSLSFAQSRTH